MPVRKKSGNLLYAPRMCFFGWVLWYINHCIYLMPNPLYIKYIGFGLVGFYGISTVETYLKPNPLYTYTLNLYDLVWFG